MFGFSAMHNHTTNLKETSHNRVRKTDAFWKRLFHARDSILTPFGHPWGPQNSSKTPPGSAQEPPKGPPETLPEALRKVTRKKACSGSRFGPQKGPLWRPKIAHVASKNLSGKLKSRFSSLKNRFLFDIFVELDVRFTFY